MSAQATIVLDVGKTLTKLSLWAPDGRLMTQCSRPNERIETGMYVGLDTSGIERFLAEGLANFARLADVGAIIPVGHGAAAAFVDDLGLVLPPMDYEHPIPTAVRLEYDALRDPFALTGSPALPDGLNLGAQLFYLESLRPDLFRGPRRVLPWAQYWSWLLCGVAASEVTSLGCHTDLWRPLARVPSELAVGLRWGEHLAPLHTAGSVLGTLRASWVRRTGLSPRVRVHCGLHDSNAALVAARACAEIAGQEATVLSTGTWFVAMRAPGGRDLHATLAVLDEKRDCLVNVDVEGNTVPSVRFMGGREIELLTGLDTRRIDILPDQPALLASVSGVLASNAMVLPSFAPGCGPYPRGRGRWISMPGDEAHRRAAVALYAALVADVALDLIGARERLVIEGRFSESQVFVRALARLRPDMRVYVCHPRSDVAYGALYLAGATRESPSALVRVEPLAEDLSEYRERWRLEAERMEQAS